MEFTRTQNGRVIHLATCRFGRRGVAWKYAKDMSIDEVRQVAERFGHKICATCLGKDRT